MLLKRTAESERNQDATIYIGNLDEKVDELILFELFLQVGPVKNINIPKDRITQTHQGYGFVEFKNIGDAKYAEDIMNGVVLFGKNVRVKKANSGGGVDSIGNISVSGSSPSPSVTAASGNTGTITDLIDSAKIIDVGANLFIGNLDELIDENFLYSTFSRFGTLIKRPTVARDEQGRSKGYGFLSFIDFESSDKAITEMDGQYLMNKIVKVNYAYKKIGASRKTKQRERHGDEAERKLAQQAKKNHYSVFKGVNNDASIINNRQSLPQQPQQPQFNAQGANFGNIRLGSQYVG